MTFLLVSSKAKVSKLAVERNRAKRRLKAAVDLVVNRSIGSGMEDGAGLLSSGEFSCN